MVIYSARDYLALTKETMSRGITVYEHDIRFHSPRRFDKGIGLNVTSCSVKGMCWDRKTGSKVPYYHPFIVDFPSKVLIIADRYGNSGKYPTKYTISHYGTSEAMLKIRHILTYLNNVKYNDNAIMTVTNSTEIVLKVSNDYFEEDSTAKGYVFTDEVDYGIPMTMTYVYYNPDKNSVTVSLRFLNERDLIVREIAMDEDIEEIGSKMVDPAPAIIEDGGEGGVLDDWSDLEREVNEEHYG